MTARIICEHRSLCLSSQTEPRILGSIQQRCYSNAIRRQRRTKMSFQPGAIYNCSAWYGRRPPRHRPSHPLTPSKGFLWLASVDHNPFSYRRLCLTWKGTEGHVIYKRRLVGLRLSVANGEGEINFEASPSFWVRVLKWGGGGRGGMQTTESLDVDRLIQWTTIAAALQSEATIVLLIRHTSVRGLRWTLCASRDF